MRVPGIEPESRPWQGRVLPLNHTRSVIFFHQIIGEKIGMRGFCFFGESVRAHPRSNDWLKCSKFFAKIADFEEAYRGTLTINMQFAAEFWTLRQSSHVLLHIWRLDGGWAIILQTLQTC